MSQKIFVGMSGGVDSSVTAALLKEQGYEVTGVFMKNWARDLPGFKCPWREDLADAKRVAVQLGIDFKVYDFQNQYKQKVVDYMIEEYEAGRTPNPDIMCNQEVKFKLFLETALEDGADMIATGHYARIVEIKNQNPQTQEGSSNRSHTSDPRCIALAQAKDTNKDQTYFLYRIREEALLKTIFPLGEMTKPEVRKKATELGLITATKKDSVGICFVGEIGIKDFLQNFVDTTTGNIIDKNSGQVVGQHEGAIFYTIGQRHGLNVGGGMPYYVVGKNMVKNEVYVTTNLNDSVLWQKSFRVTDAHWISSGQLVPLEQINVRTRHRAPLIGCTIVENDDHSITVNLRDDIRALTPGQSAVFYQNDICLGGGIIAEV